MPQAGSLAMKEDLSHTMAIWGKGQLILQPTEEPGVTLSTPELPRAGLNLVLSVKQKWQSSTSQVLQEVSVLHAEVYTYFSLCCYQATNCRCLEWTLEQNAVQPGQQSSEAQLKMAWFNLWYWSFVQNFKQGLKKNWDHNLSGKSSGIIFSKWHFITTPSLVLTRINISPL